MSTLAKDLAADIISNLDYDDVPYSEILTDDGSICLVVSDDRGTARITIEQL